MMKNYQELASDLKIGNVCRCPCGKVTINIKGVSLHFTEDAFALLVFLMTDAHSRLMDIGLTGILNEKDKNEDS